MFSPTSIVISKKIYNDNSLLNAKSFIASLAVHGVLFLGMFYFISSPMISDEPKKHVVIVLNNFIKKADNIHKSESSASPIGKPVFQKNSITTITQESPFQQVQSPQKYTKTFQETQPFIPSVSPEASAPLAYSVPMPASAPQSASNDSPHQATSSTPVHELPKAPVAGNDISGAALGHIRAMIEKAIIYPTIARKLRLEGIVTVFFILNSDGTVDQLHISTTSGSKILDDKALSTILNLSGNFPALGKSVELKIPIAFNLS